MKTLAAFVAALTLLVPATAGAGTFKENTHAHVCEYLILSVPPVGAMPRILATAKNYGQALKIQRLFTDNGIVTRIGGVCTK